MHQVVLSQFLLQGIYLPFYIYEKKKKKKITSEADNGSLIMQIPIFSGRISVRTDLPVPGGPISF